MIDKLTTYLYHLFFLNERPCFMISFAKATLQRGTKVLLEDTSALIHNRETVGLIGRNGAGKSSIFGLILNQLELMSGELSFPKSLRLSHLAQETPALDLSAQDYVLNGDTEYRHIETQMAKETDLNKLAILQENFETADGYRKPSQACALLHGLGFGADEFKLSVSSFSGGWRMRLNLAQCLMCPADLLLLDEPTNHLDLDAIFFLEKRLKQFEGTLLIISHDKAFLNRLCTTMIHIENQKLNRYQGNYDAFERIRGEQLLLQHKMYEKQQKHISHMMSFVERFKAKASKAKQAQSRVKAIEKIEQIALAHIDSPIQFSFKPCKPCSSPIISLEDVSIGYDDLALIKRINLSVEYGERIALLGPNGVGKSTFLKLLADKLQPLEGQLFKAPHHLSVAYYEQHQLEQLQLDASPLEHLQHKYPKESEQVLRNHLGQFGFHGETVLENIAPLSGGEKARLVLALLLFDAPNLLLLDEPTNHLDLDTRAALEMALQSFQGSLILISHDRHLLSTTVDTFYLLADKSISEFDGDLDDYERWLLSSDKKKTNKQTDTKTDKESKPSKKTLNRIKKIETELDTLSKKMQTVEQTLGLNSTYEDAALMNKCLQQQQTLQASIDVFEEEWLDLQDE